MAPCDWLRGLQMGKAWHHPIGARLGLRQKRADQRLQTLIGGVQLVPHPEFKIGRDLVVPAAARVQAACGLTDQVFQPRLDVHVDVFERG